MSYIKGIKFIIVGIALSICLILPGEIYQMYLEQFDDFYKMSFYLSEGASSEEMNQSIADCAEKNGLFVFRIVDEAKSIVSTQINIFADEKARGYLKNEYSISSGEHSSLFMGKSNVDFYDFISVPSEKGLEVEYSLAGNEEDMKSFYVEISEQCRCSAPSHNGYESRSSYENMITAAWAMLVLLCCFMTIYDCAFQKKESYIRMSLGENMKMRAIKNVVADTVFFALLSVVVILLASSATNVFFMFSVTIKGLVLMLFVNAVSYVNIIPRSVKALTGKDKSSKKLLTVNYVLKSVCVILTCLVISTNIATISECVSYMKQKEFFEAHDDYNWYSRIKSTETNSDRCESQFYFEFLDEMDIFYLCQWSSLSDSGKGICEANRNAKDYLMQEIEGFGDLDFTKSAHVLINKNEKLSDVDLEELELLASSWADGEVEFYYYTKTERIVVRTYGMYPDTLWVKNPIIIYYNIDPIDNITEVPDINAFPLNFCMVRTDGDKLAEFAERYGMTYEETNALDYYEYKLTSVSRTLYLNLILSAIILFLEILVTATVIRLEYSVNSTELAVKKVLGYSNLKRFSLLYTISVVLWMISAVLAIAISHVMKFGETPYIIIGALVILIFDLTIITVNTLKQDKQKIPKILKGGSL